MKELTVISGKGGTGKTTITAAFASLADNAVFADCDVDAADLHLILEPKIKKTMIFHGLKIPSIKKDECIDCKKCYENCRFDAIDNEINLIKDKCEGCKLCEYICPVNAIDMVDRESGFAYISDTRFGSMAHARLKTAEEASGKLITMVRESAKELCEKEEKDLIIIDGPPGIGCPVISSITGVDMVLVVTEPTLSAVQDLKRIIGVAKHFKIPASVCINKYNINLQNSEDIEKFCNENSIDIVGKIPYDKVFTEAMVKGKNVIEFQEKEISNKIEKMWKKIEMNIN